MIRDGNRGARGRCSEGVQLPGGLRLGKGRRERCQKGRVGAGEGGSWGEHSFIHERVCSGDVVEDCGFFKDEIVTADTHRERDNRAFGA